MKPVNKIDLPESFTARMKRMLGIEYPAFLESYQSPPAAGLRVNPQKITPKTFSAIAPFDLTAIPWCREGFIILSGEGRPGKHPYHAAGLYYLQDPSAMLAVELLDPHPGECVLDLAAAPGGKATHIISKMQDRGLFFANEIHPKRVWELAGNLERWGAQNTVITNESPQRLADLLEGYFDKVLLDAPCSGEGMFRKSETARREWSLDVVRSCAVRQQGILHQAARLVKPGGRLVYATCTFSPEENECVTAQFLNSHKNFSLESAPDGFSCQPGQPGWLVGSNKSREIEKTLRCWPQHDMPEGHFYAILHRSEADHTDRMKIRSRRQAISKDILQLYDDFVADNLQINHIPGVLRLVKTHVYLTPESIPDISNLRIIHPGLWMGVIKRKRFEPAHALALTLKADQAQRVVDFNASEKEVLSYLRGEQIAVEFADEGGWTLVTVDGFSLGWGKRTRKVMKNYYPKGLRWY